MNPVNIFVLKTLQMHAKQVLYVKALLRTLQAGCQNTNPLIKRLSRLLRKNFGFSVRISTVKETVQHITQRFLIQGSVLL